MNTWEYQMAMFPPTGPPKSIQYEERYYDDDPKMPVDCLLYYDQHGELIGIMEHYPQDIYAPTAPEGAPVANKGATITWNRPDHDFVPVCLALCREAGRRWDDIDPFRDWDNLFPHCKDAAHAWFKAYPEWKTGEKFDPDAVDAARAAKAAEEAATQGEPTG